MSLSPQDMVARAKATIRELSPVDARQFVADEKPFIIDVREPGELGPGFIPGSDNIPRGVLEFKIQNHEELNNKSRPVLVYCQTGMRGALATETLAMKGYDKACNLAGGFEKWLEALLPVEKDPDSW